MNKHLKNIQKRLKSIMEKLKRFLNPSPMSEQSEGKLIRYMITREVLKRE